MMKTKQATLFSLKSWKNVAAEGIQKYKDILENHNKTDSEILSALFALKRKNPSRDVILSTKIDVSLESLEKHQNSSISDLARTLRNHWQLNNKRTSEIIVIDEDEHPAKKRRILPETEKCEIKTIPNQTVESNKLQVISNLHEKKVPNVAFLLNTKESTALIDSKSTKSTLKSPAVNRASAISQSQGKKPPIMASLVNIKESVKLADAKSTKTVLKSPSVNRATYNKIMNQLRDAVQLFTQELGEQEVRLYLEK